MFKMLKNERGMAMLAVVAIISIATILIFSIVWYAGEALSLSTKDKGNTHAYMIANAGLDKALAIMQANGYHAADYPVTGTVDGGTYTVMVEPSTNSQFKAVGRGVSATGEIEEIVVKFFYLNIWQMNLAGGSSQAMGGGTLHGNAGVRGPFYIRGTAALGGDSRIDGGPLFINGGNLILQGNGKVGANGAIDAFISGSYPPIGPSFNVNSVSSAVPPITLPVVDGSYLTMTYYQAKAESVDNKMGISADINNEATDRIPTTYTTVNPPNNGWTRSKAPGASLCYKIIGADDGPSSINTGTHSLTLNTTSFGSWYGDGHTLTPGQHDDFAYDAVNKILYVEGTVFIDGSLTVVPNIRYRGKGTLVVNGDVNLNDWIPDTADNMMDETHAVGIVTPNNINVNRASVTGAFYCSQWFNMYTTNATSTGSVIAGGINFEKPNDVLIQDPDLVNFLPPNLPGNGQSILTRGTWARP